MKLWVHWWRAISKLRPACSRLRSFLWMATAVAGLSVRPDLLGVTSIIRALGLEALCYDRLLDFFHSRAVDLEKLTRLWVTLVLEIFPGPYTVNGRLVLLGDGLKVPKEGRKMPAVKLLHQESASNTKPEYIMGHSCQAVALLGKAMESSFFAIPLACRIHEGLIFSNRDKRTLLDKMLLLVESLGITSPSYFIGDAFFASGAIALGFTSRGNHLITRVRTNAVAYEAPLPRPKTRGRKRKYGEKRHLVSLFHETETFQRAPSPLYGERGVQIFWRSLDLLWKPVGMPVRFVWVLHPSRGRIILMTTDTTLSPLEVIRLYGLRFKIELSFKQSLRVLGTYAYHFWMMAMVRIQRRSGDQYMHRKSDAYRNGVRRKLGAYHTHIQLGLIAQGLLQYLSATFPTLVWASFGSWLRTIRPDICPSELVTATAMRNALPQFLTTSSVGAILTKFLLERIDFTRAEGLRLAG
jgi:hypothetical protein